jgi:hypothetical protein
VGAASAAIKLSRMNPLSPNISQVFESKDFPQRTKNMAPEIADSLMRE